MTHSIQWHEQFAKSVKQEIIQALISYKARTCLWESNNLSKTKNMMNVKEWASVRTLDSLARWQQWMKWYTSQRIGELQGGDGAVNIIKAFVIQGWLTHSSCIQHHWEPHPSTSQLLLKPFQGVLKRGCKPSNAQSTCPRQLTHSYTAPFTWLCVLYLFM